MTLRRWLRPPRHVLAIFVVVAVVSAAALGWLVWLLLEQEKAVELQRTQERLEQAADRAAAMMQAALADIDRASEPPPGVVLVRIAGDDLMVQPERTLLYYPEIPLHNSYPESHFAEAEQSEFVRKDLKPAAELYAGLAETRDISLRAAALTRLARVYRKAKDYAKALRVYDNLFGMTDVVVGDLPAGLIARDGRAEIFQVTNRPADLKKEAEALRNDLRAGRWRITRYQYEFFTGEADQWVGAIESPPDLDAIARAEAVAWLWQNRHNSAQVLRRVIDTGSGPALIINGSATDTVSAAVAGPKYLSSLCRESAPDPAMKCTLSDAEGHVLIGQLPPARAAIRTAAATRLPWTLQVSGTASGLATTPRRLLLWVAVVLTAVWLTGAAFIIRAISRETRVAQLQSDFVAAVSHEFRSPLSSLCQISEMLASNRFESEEVRHNAYKVLTRESERLRRLVKGLLDFRRLDSGAETYHFERIEIGEFLESIVEDFRATVSDAGYTVELRGAEPGTFVKGDSDALSRAIWNLLDNAVKYSPECHTIGIDVECFQKRVSIAVHDRGLGIPIHEQHDIFEKFVRGAESKARRIKGTGIGLAMVRHIVQAHGGEILLASRPGEGSRFTIVFPQEARS